MRDVGQMGECAFQSWCAESGIVANKANVDKTGWDYYIEFPMPELKNALTLHNAGVECKVQVKSTDGRTGKVAISLSNLRRLVCAPIPAFIIFIEFDNLNYPQRAFLVHIDDDVVYRVLERIREKTLDDKDFKLNRSTLTIKYDDKDQVLELNGEGLKSKIFSLIPEGVSSYVEAKRKKLEKIGFEDGFAKLNFTTSGRDNLNDLIDVSLGLKERASIANLNSYFTRFGLIDKVPALALGAGFIEMPDLKPTFNAQISFQKSKFSPKILFDCEIFVSPFNSYLVKDEQKVRFKSYGFEFLMYPSLGKFEWKFNDISEKLISLQSMKKHYDLYFLLNCSGDNVFVTVTLEDGRTQIFNGKAHHSEDELLEFRGFINDAKKILTFFEVVEELKLTAKDVWNNGASYKKLNSMINATTSIKVGFNLDSDFEEDLRGPFALIGLMSCNLGGYFFGIIFVWEGESLLKKEQYKLLVEKNIVERIISFPLSKLATRDELLYLISEVEDKYKKTHVVINLIGQDLII